MIDSLIQKIKEQLGIRSPSKEWHLVPSCRGCYYETEEGPIGCKYAMACGSERSLYVEKD